MSYNAIGYSEIEQRQKHDGPWTPWEPFKQLGMLAEVIPKMLTKGNSVTRVAWKADYGTVFEYRRKKVK